MENKTGKYFKYAIGEIILVVIGILIALQINNWNEQNAIHEKQKKHLGAIKNEMSNNLKSLQLEQNRLEDVIINSRKLITLIDSKIERQQMPQKELSAIFFNYGSNPTFKIPYENGALTELISSGGLKDIENDNIRNILASWEGTLTRLREQEKEIEKVTEGIQELVIMIVNIRTVFDDIGYSKDVLKIEKTQKNPNYNLLLDSDEYENRLIYYMAITTRLNITVYPNFKDKLEDVINLIDIELAND
jgi:hypothetical protein